MADARSALDLDFYADIDGMHDAFSRCVPQGPVWRDEANEMWAVVQHGPLIDVERRADVFSSSGCYRSRVAPQEEDMIAKDDPAHHEQRALVARRFTPKAVQRLEPVIGAVIDDLVDGFVGTRRARRRRRPRRAVPRASDRASDRLRRGALARGALVVRAADAHRRHPRRRDADDGHGGRDHGVRELLGPLAEDRRARAAATIWSRSGRTASSAVARWSSRSWCRRRACSSRAVRRRRARLSRAGSSN